MLLLHLRGCQMLNSGRGGELVAHSGHPRTTFAIPGPCFAKETVNLQYTAPSVGGWSIKNSM
jgi:hypothetical protein